MNYQYEELLIHIFHQSLVQLLLLQHLIQLFDLLVCQVIFHLRSYLNLIKKEFTNYSKKIDNYNGFLGPQ